MKENEPMKENETMCGCSGCRHQKTCRSEKMTMRTQEEQKKLQNRLSRIEGQVRGLEKMVSENRYCIDILTQSAAVTAAMNAFNKELLAHHIQTCVADNLRAGNDEVLDELVSTIEKLMK